MTLVKITGLKHCRNFCEQIKNPDISIGVFNFKTILSGSNHIGIIIPNIIKVQLEAAKQNHCLFWACR
jgi:hypothetical protein